MRHIEQVNALLKIKLANLISKEICLDNGLITVSYADCSKDLKHANIGVSILPENLSGTALAEFKKHNSLFTKILKKETRLRIIPRFNWVIDSTEKNAAKIEKVLQQIREEKND
ncbi:hypothetical protein CO115_04495 [Candidatus Falkowbacteria bacterium CG_4_9_14_3_um_filter_36_9]|uniref:Ribosome-binding factor A n=2 Tax=Candidatus Falkowiibacteriota TaxID=1752728 RepID=A0A1J4TC51_9BACT|nr:MAG: hypothetical protein AUJ27_01810 [Candidatus Falkowbacteria bacterium CG1_02_37_44]PIV52174.1 MAG: hypothetical protein COS18_00025 [Candidatus Falkowbacteria bacterium CG02_land_8_20_14_3_00_36_14]PJA10618.1 MAG: hypothetical protein COX67_04130 [Candidatus Falkowbacteria bacterium CG_4_10_14_0_2_um_filter_36_22]PJB18449.1 MAG: hypothetical protein CO115_04495 [Candidatus Falkowbacteria bacterium CG_4_9_14_3_um_filter_36_9]